MAWGSYEEHKRERESLAFVKGYHEYDEDMFWADKCEYIVQNLIDCYEKGWTKKADEIADYNAKPDCPVCGSKLGELMSGLRCYDVDGCGYHTHYGEKLT